MNAPSLIELLIVALGFGIVGAYVLCCRLFVNAAEKETVEPAQTEHSNDSGQQGSQLAHA